MRRLSFFLCYQRVPMDNAACADDNDATLHTVLFDFEMSPCQSSKAERGRPKADRAKQSIHRHFLHSNQCSWNVWFCNQKVIWQMFWFRKHDAMCSKRHFVTIMHPDHSRHSSSFTFQMGFLLFLCFLIETSSRRKKKPKRENILVKASPIANYFSVYCACGCKKGMCV